MSVAEEAFARAALARARIRARRADAAKARTKLPSHHRPVAARGPAGPAPPRPPACGTGGGYRAGCRCAPCGAAKHAENRRREWTAGADTAARAEQALVWRRARYREAVVAATGELAALIAEQAADARQYRVWSAELTDRYGPGVEWEDPTVDAALARLAA